MIGYSDLLQTMAAMVLFSIILMHSNRMIIKNTTVQVETEIEQQIISIAQEIIDESKTLAFDEVTQAGNVPVTIPGGFSNLGADAGEVQTNRTTFDDFDDFNGWAGVVTTPQGDFNVSTSLTYINPLNNTPTTSKTTLKQIEVTITSVFVNNNGTSVPKIFRFNFLRSFYAD